MPVDDLNAFRIRRLPAGGRKRAAGPDIVLDDLYTMSPSGTDNDDGGWNHKALIALARQRVQVDGRG